MKLFRSSVKEAGGPIRLPGGSARTGFLWPVLLAAGIAVLAACGGPAPAASPPAHHQHHSSRTSSSPPPTPAPSGTLDPLTGLATPVHGPLVALMIENSEYARPQFGLSSADVVYETYMESFYYTRFMALYWGHAPKTVGPVRSARPYFVSWVHSWNAAYAHAGGSTLGDQAIINDGVHNMDGLANAQSLYYRTTSLPAPHNLFSNMVNLMAYAQRQWGNPAVTPEWSFASPTPAGASAPPYQTITMRWNTRNTIEQWRWNSADAGYTRWVMCPVSCSQTGYTQVMGQNAHRPVVAKNIIFQYTTEYLDNSDPNPNPGDRWILIDTHGQGVAKMFLGNRYYVGTWRNAGPGQPTKFYLANGQPARFDPGQTWIEVVPTAASGTSFQLTLSPAATP